MILCATLNPCIDKTLTTPLWRPGDSVRGRTVRETAGGKGNNVARALSRLGRDAKPISFFGGRTGAQAVELLAKQDGLEAIRVDAIAQTRVILTVRSESGVPDTAFFDPDPAVTEVEAKNFIKTASAILNEGNVEAVSLSGSSPSPATHGVYAELVVLARTHQIPVFVDTYGPSLAHISISWPNVLQMNRKEASGRLGKSKASEGELVAYLSTLSKQGVRLALVTDGPNPFFCSIEGVLHRVHPPAIEPVNPIGSGDCLLAGLIDGWLGGMELVEVVRRGTAAAVANALVWDAGAIDRTLVDQIAVGVQVERIEGQAIASLPSL